MVEKIQSKEKTRSSSGSSLNSLYLGSEIEHRCGMEPAEQLQSRQDVEDAAWVLFNMSLQLDDSAEKNISDPFIGFPKKKRSIPRNVSPIDQLQCAQDINDPFTAFPKKKRSIPQWVSRAQDMDDDDDVARVLCNMSFSHTNLSQNPNLVAPNRNPQKMRLKITSCDCSQVLAQSRPFIGIKRRLQIQETCGEAQICKKQRTAPEMPQKVKDRILKMGGSEASFLIQKTLQCSDTNHQQARLQIPVKQVDNDFLSKEEEAVLEQTNQGIAVLLIQPSNNISTHCLKKRRMGKAAVYHITNKWNAIIDDQANGLTTGATIQIWSFRTHTHLCFAMVTL